jgi:polyribonucleotide nucleotidyltransferase
VAGTANGITALQMDMKVHGLPVEILAQAIKQSKTGRLEILKHMVSIIKEPRAKISDYAPRIEKVKINPEKIGTVIGKGGETINKITSETGAQIDIADDGLVTIAGVDPVAIQKAVDWVKGLVEEPEVGKIYKGKVVGIKEFGAFVNIIPGTDGMLHISRISEKRLNKVEDALSMGQEVYVLLEAIDDRGRLSLTMKGVPQQ